MMMMMMMIARYWSKIADLNLSPLFVTSVGVTSLKFHRDL